MKDYREVEIQIIKIDSDIIMSSGGEDEQGMYERDIFH